VTLHESLAHIERLLLFSLQAEPTANINELQEVLKREQQRIETLEIRHLQQHIQRRITDFLVPPASTPTYCGEGATQVGSPPRVGSSVRGNSHTEEGKKYHLVYVLKLADVLATGVTSQPRCASAS